MHNPAETKFIIDFLGNLRICEQHPLILGNLFEDDFFELIDKQQIRQFRNNILQIHPDGQDFSKCNLGCKIETLLTNPVWLFKDYGREENYD